MSKSIDYEAYLIDSLKDPEEAIGYLRAALKSRDWNTLLMALEHIIKARSKVSILAEKLLKIFINLETITKDE